MKISAGNFFWSSFWKSHQQIPIMNNSGVLFQESPVKTQEENLRRNFWRIPTDYSKKYLQRLLLQESPGRIPGGILRRKSWWYLQRYLLEKSSESSFKKNPIGTSSEISRENSWMNNPGGILRGLSWRNVQTELLEKFSAETFIEVFRRHFKMNSDKSWSNPQRKKIPYNYFHWNS